MTHVLLALYLLPALLIGWALTSLAGEADAERGANGEPPQGLRARLLGAAIIALIALLWPLLATAGMVAVAMGDAPPGTKP